MFGEKNLGKCTFYFGIEVIPRFWSYTQKLPFFFIFTNATNTFGKNYFNTNLPVSER